MQDVLDDKLALVSLSFGMFGGYRRATPEHIKKLGGKLPKSKAITEGSIKIFPGDALKDFCTIRRGLFRDIGKMAIKALDSRSVFAVPRNELPAVEKLIADAAQEYSDAVAQLDANYDALFEKHVAANKEADAIIRSLKVGRVDAVAKCHFKEHIFQIKPFVREGESKEEGVDAIVRGLGRQLFDEVAMEMVKLEENDAFKRSKVGQKSLRPIKAAAEKLEKFTFLDDAVQGAIDLVANTLAMLPREGYIEGAEFKTLQRLVQVMSDTDDLVNAASKVKNGIQVIDVLFPQLAASQQQPLPEQTVEEAQPAPVAAAPQLVAVPALPPVSSAVTPAAPAPGSVLRKSLATRPTLMF